MMHCGQDLAPLNFNLFYKFADYGTERYLSMLEKNRVRGTLFEQQNYIDASQLATPAKK
jgi:hypothetical protein